MIRRKNIHISTAGSLLVLLIFFINSFNLYSQSVCRDISVALDENGEAEIRPVNLVDVVFQAGNQTFPPDAQCDWSVAGDFNGDELLDFTISVRNGTGIIAINLGGGLFNLPGVISEMNGYHLAHDLDGDGDLDIVLINQGELAEGFVKIFLNDGSANFTNSGQTLGLGQKLSIADVDGDLDPDLVISNDEQANEIWLNDGSANFVNSGNTIGTVINSLGIAMADLDNDGDIDAVKPENIWLNDGTGKFIPGQNLSGSANTVITSDFNRDGKPDIATSNGEIFLNDGTGNFALFYTILYTAGFGDDVISYDLDRDGDEDLIFTNVGLSIPNTLWFNNGEGNFITFQPLSTGSNYTVSPGELTGDGNIDLFFPDSRPGANNAAWVSKTVIETYCGVPGTDPVVQGLSDSASWLSQSFFDCSDKGIVQVNVDIPLVGCTATLNCVSNVTVEDRRAPDIVCKDTFLLIETGIQRSITADDISSGSYDNCGIASKTLSRSIFGEADLGTNLVTLTLEDAEGNSSSCDFKVNVLKMNLEATDSVSDGYIDLSWSIPVQCYIGAGGQSLYLQIKRLDNNQEVYSETIDDPNQFNQNTGYYSSGWQHLVGPDQNIEYQLNLYIIGFGFPICESPTDFGSTVPFREPDVSASDSSLALVEINVTNFSDLLNYYKVYRNGQFIFNLSGDSLASYNDLINTSAIKSIKNGKAYQYCIRVYNEELDAEFGLVCDSGRTFDMDFQATDLLYLDKIELSWNSIDLFADNIAIKRDGVVLGLIPASETSFIDLDVVPGKDHIYGITAINGTGEVEVDRDEGSTPANGSISGNVYTQAGNYAVPGVPLEAFVTIDGDTLPSYFTSTDLNGFYRFDDLFYDDGAKFTLKVIDSTRTFVKNPIKVSLSLVNPSKTGIDFIDLAELPFDTTGLAINLSSLQINAISQQDRLELSATYNVSPDTVWFQLYRSTADTSIPKELISLTNSIGNTFPVKDNTGIPGDLYTYDLTAYSFVNGVIRSVTVSNSAVFPDVTPPALLLANANFLLGNAVLNFSQPSSNVDGINIYRNGDLIATLSRRDTTYQDNGGQPGELTTYSITCFREVAGSEYESTPLVAPSISYPILFPVNLKGYSVSALPHHVELKWSYPLLPEFNFSGFIIFRKPVNGSVFKDIFRISKDYLKAINGQYRYFDQTVKPDSIYDYKIAVFNSDNGQDFTEESPVLDSVIVLPVLPVSNVEATDGIHPDKIVIRWDYPSYPELIGTGQSFHIFRDQLLIGKVPYKENRKFVDYINKPQPDSKKYIYSVYAVLNRGGEEFYSITATDTGSRKVEQYLTLPVSNFIASTDYTDYIKLSWEYPNYITKAGFYLVRDSINILSPNIDSLNRIFYDVNPGPGEHTYQIWAFIEDSLPNGVIPGFSQVQTAQGQLLSKRVVRGIVSTVKDQQGVSGVKITAYNDPDDPSLPFEAVTYTNANGFYEFPSLDYGYDPGDVLFIHAELLNSDINPSTKTVTFSDTSNIYTVNFSDYSPSGIESGDSIAQPINTVVLANPQTGSVEISWDASNNNYSAFSVYRGLGQISIVDAFTPKFVIDSTGFPGTNYQYSVVGLWQINDTILQISRPDTQTVQFPPIEPVTEFIVVPSFLNNYVTINWTHPNTVVDGFIIKRTNDTIADIPHQSLPEFIDLTGVPGYTYKYSILPYKDTDYGRAFGQETVKTVEYPDLTRAQNYTIGPLFNGLALRWSLTADNFDGFNLYRNGNYLRSGNRDTMGSVCYSFEDYEGVPGHLDTFTIRTFVIREGIPYESSPKSVFSQVPYITPTNSFDLQLTSNADSQSVKLSWDYPDTNGIDGFYVFQRETADTSSEPQLLADLKTYVSLSGVNIALPTEITSGICTYIIPFISYNFTFTDINSDAIPETEYTYTVIPYSEREDSIYTPVAPCAEKSIMFPKIPRPYDLTLINKNSYHDIKWEHIWMDVDSFEVTYFADVPYSQNYFIDGSERKLINLDINMPFDPVNWFGYSVRAIKTINSVTYYSDYRDVIEISNPNQVSAGYVPRTDASDGTGPNVELSWTFDVLPPGTPTYKVYRNGSLLNAASINTADQTAVDPTAIAGKKYVYEVVATVGGVPSSRDGDIGFAKPDGILSGTVIVDGKGIGVPGVNVSASAYIDNTWYTYYATSLNNGSGTFIIENVYYGANSGSYKLVATMDENEIVGDNDEPYNISVLAPGTGQNIDNDILFRDKTTYLISGNIAQRFNECPIQDIVVTLTTYYGQDTFKTDSTITDANGFYSFVADVFLDNIDKYIVEVRDIQSKTEGPVTTRELHDFRPKYDTGFAGSRYEILFEDLERSNERNFRDAYRYSIDIITQNVCNPVEESFKVNIRSEDNCVDTTINSTAAGGFSVVQLAPRNYILSVIDVNNPSPSNVVIKDYLQKRPVELRLKDLHDLRLTDSGTGMSRTEVAEEARTRFTFHKIPFITEEFTGNEEVCEDITDIVIKQGNTIEINFLVNEIFDNQPCHVNEGSIVIVNEAGESEFPVLEYDPGSGGFPAYTFVAGQPNVIKPFKRAIKFQYYSGRGELLREKVIGVIIIGTADIPGNDVFILPEDESDEDDSSVKMPLYVLRDPPGDLSYSTLLENKTITKSVKMEYSSSDGGGFITDGQIGSLAGAFWKVDIKEGEATTKTKSYDFELSTTTSYSTSSSPNDVGEDADIIVGAGVAFQYGIVQELTIDPDQCEIIKQQRVGISPNQLSTTWIYPVSQIKDFITEYVQKIADIENGTLVLEPNEAGFNTEKFQAIKDNWENILAYHRKQLVPHYQICRKLNNEYSLAQNFSTTIFNQSAFAENDNNNFLQSISSGQQAKQFVDQYKAKLTTALNAFCPLVYDETTDELLKESNSDQNKFWNNDILEKYNAILNFYSELLRGFLNKELAGTIQPFDPTDNSVIYNNAYNLAFQTDAENLTVGGGANVTKQLAVGISNTNTLKQTAFYNRLEGGGFSSSTSINVGLGFGVSGFGVFASANIVANIFRYSANVGYSRQVSMSFSEQQTSTVSVNNTTSYTISDDDLGDQVSVTVIKTPAKNQTAYFQLFGGRSSCPYEEGTIARDDPRLALVDAQGVVASSEQVLVPDGGTALFPLQIGNNNPFGETRDYDVFLDPQSNSNAATVKLNGTQIGSVSMGGIDPNNPLYTLLSVQQGPVSYEYNNLKIGIQTTCPEDDRTFYQEVTVHFVEPCPNIDLVNPSNGWVINQATQTLVVYTDFNINSGTLDKISLEGRRVGTNYWDDFVAVSNLEYSKAEIVSFYEDFGTIPVFVMDVSGHPSITDGNYEVRAKLVCKDLSETYSNIISGKIDRTAPFVIGNPIPSDGVLAQYDEISAIFNEDLDCAEFYANGIGSFTLYNATQSKVVSGIPACLDNKLLFTISDNSINNGDSLVATIDGFRDLNGNSMAAPVSWGFLYMPLPPQPCESPLTIYTSNLTSTSAKLNGISLSNGNTYTVIGGISGNVDTAMINVVGSLSQFSFDATGLTPNTTYWWTVKTICDNGESDYFIPINIFTTLPSCNAPVTLSHANVTSSKATLLWSSVPNASSYEIQGREKTDLFKIAKIVVPGGSTSFIAKGLKPATIYEWSIRSYCPSVGYSQLSLPYDTFRTDSASAIQSVKNGNWYGSSLSSLSVLVLPNPTTTGFELYVENDLDEWMEVKLYNTIGELIQRWETSQPGLRERIDISQLPAGVYLVTVQSGDRSETVRVVKR